MKAAIQALHGALRAAGAVTIRITDGSSTGSLAAIPGRTTVQTATGDMLQTLETRDYIFDPVDLTLAGLPNPPRARAKIEELDAAGAVTATYTANHPTGERHWRYTDPYRTLIRLHAMEH